MFKVFDILRCFNIGWLLIKGHIIRVTLVAFITMVIIISNPCPIEASFPPRPEQVSFENIYFFFQPLERFSQCRVNSMGVGGCDFVEGRFHDGKFCNKLLSGFSSCISSGEINTEQPNEKSSDNAEKTANNGTIQWLGSFLMYLSFGLIGAGIPFWVTFKFILTAKKTHCTKINPGT